MGLEYKIQQRQKWQPQNLYSGNNLEKLLKKENYIGKFKIDDIKNIMVAWQLGKKTWKEKADKFKIRNAEKKIIVLG